MSPPFDEPPRLQDVIGELIPLYGIDDDDRAENVGPELPHRRRIIEAFELLKAALLPGGMSPEAVQPELLETFLNERLSRAFRLLSVEVSRALAFRWRGAYVRSEVARGAPEPERVPHEQRLHEAWELTKRYFATLPGIRRMLIDDIVAAYNGDPAAMSYAEVMLTYPGLHAIAAHRIAHELQLLDVPLVPRVMSEYMHATLGIDIHPGAEIGQSFFIDHGTGVVIGETCRIGNHVKLYQGVTLGAKSFPLDDDGHPQKKIPRHPIVEDHVVIYAGATILGPVTIGEGSEIGANVFLTRDVAAGSQVRPQAVVRTPETQVR